MQWTVPRIDTRQIRVNIDARQVCIKIDAMQIREFYCLVLSRCQLLLCNIRPAAFFRKIATSARRNAPDHASCAVCVAIPGICDSAQRKRRTPKSTLVLWYAWIHTYPMNNAKIGSVFFDGHADMRRGAEASQHLRIRI